MGETKPKIIESSDVPRPSEEFVDSVTGRTVEQAKAASAKGGRITRDELDAILAEEGTSMAEIRADVAAKAEESLIEDPDNPATQE